VKVIQIPWMDPKKTSSIKHPIKKNFICGQLEAHLDKPQGEVDFTIWHGCLGNVELTNWEGGLGNMDLTM